MIEVQANKRQCQNGLNKTACQLSALQIASLSFGNIFVCFCKFVYSSKNCKMKVDTAPTQTDKPKIPLPTLSQINADRITQVR